MINAVIIDDLLGDRNDLKRKINKCILSENVSIVGEADNIIDGKKLIDVFKPDIVFLDIEMPGGSGFDLLDMIDNITFEIIITTVHDECASKAFEYSALHFLEKPVEVDKLEDAIERYLKNKKPNISFEQIEVLLKNHRNFHDIDNPIALPDSNGLDFIKLKNIIRCEADSNLTHIYTIDKSKHTICKTLQKVSELLCEHNIFLRVHESHLINLHYIKKYNKGDGGTARMIDDSVAYISREGKNRLFKRMDDLGMRIK